jgi:hypothetical protein
MVAMRFVSKDKRIVATLLVARVSFYRLQPRSRVFQVAGLVFQE